MVSLMNCSGLYYHSITRTILDKHSGVFKYDTDTHTFFPVEQFSKQDKRVLACLLAHRGLLVTKETLLSEAWAGRVVSGNSINVTICRLRTKLKVIDPIYGCLVTARNIGFSLSLCRSGLIPITSIDLLLKSLE